MAHSSAAVLIITRNLPPLVGGMERLIWHIVNALNTHYQTSVVGPQGCKAHLDETIDAREVPLKPLPRFVLSAAWNALKLAIRKHPRIILAGSGLTAPLAWLAARLTGARCVVYLHGLDVEAQHLAYRLLWRPVFKHFDLVIVNSHFTHGLAQQAGVPAARIRILHPGVALPDFSQRQTARAAFRQELQLGDAPVMLYVGRITPRKGLAPFVEHALPRIMAAVPNARLVVIGDEPQGALLNAARGERARAEETLRNAQLSHAVHFLGERPQDDPILSAAYFGADVMIFPVQDRPGDNEGFGMVAIEAAAHGLPTVAFSVGGVTDAVKDGVSGRLLPAGNNEQFALAVTEYLKNMGILAAQIHEFSTKFEWDFFNKSLHQLIRNTDV